MAHVHGHCRMCGTQGALHESHIIPSFVYRWLKKTGGPIRLTTEPNRRVQDGLKEYWLCSDCEDQFGKREKLFAEKIFHQSKPTPHSIQFDDWLYYFATSLAWRTVEFAHGKNPDAEYSPQQEQLTLEAKEAWRAYLLGDGKPRSKFPQHVLYFQSGSETNVSRLPSNWHRFQLRHVTLDIVGSSKSLMTYTKLGPFTFLGMIQHQKRQWEGTRINTSGGRFPPKKVVLPRSILSLFEEKAALSVDAFKSVSEKQNRVIRQTMETRLKNPKGDAHIEALLADYQLFGPAIFKDE